MLQNIAHKDKLEKKLQAKFSKFQMLDFRQSFWKRKWF